MCCADKQVKRIRNLLFKDLLLLVSYYTIDYSIGKTNRASKTCGYLFGM